MNILVGFCNVFNASETNRRRSSEFVATAVMTAAAAAAVAVAKVQL